MTHYCCLILASLVPGQDCSCRDQSPQKVFVAPSPVVEYGPAYEPGRSDRERRLLPLRGPGSAGQTRFFYVEPTVELAPTPAPLARPASPYAHPAPPEQPLAAGEEQAEPPQSGLNDLHIAEKYMEQVGHEDDYSWVTGHLFYVRADGGRWVLRYALPDQVDRYGGSIVLAPGVEMKNFREGDLVCVFGRVVSSARTSPALAAPLYQVDTITLVERADP